MPPSDPPDLTPTSMEEDPPRKLSYKEMTEEKNGLNYGKADYSMNFENLQSADMGTEDNPIQFSNTEKQRLYNPWKRSVIIKSEDFYTVKLTLEESQKRILLEDPWFVASSYISTRVGEPNFVPSRSKVTSIVIWVRLPSLPTEFYDRSVLEKIGKRVGSLLKIDSCTSSFLRGRPADVESKKDAQKGTELNVTQQAPSEWQTVSFIRKGKKTRKGKTSTSGMNQPDKSSVKIKSFDPKSGKFLDPANIKPTPSMDAKVASSSGKDNESFKTDHTNLGQPNSNGNGKRPISFNAKFRPSNKSRGLLFQHNKYTWA
ncbi:hypothetical protein BC332_15822 [Capsicum chinense]|nr:hypothetical protein BC332_15822 [Capsicum chinense]